MIVPDLRGAGDSAKPEDGYNKKNMAVDIRELVTSKPVPGRKAFERDAAEFAEMGKTPLPMPMLVLSGEKAGGSFLIEQGRMVAGNVKGVIVKGSGHWLMEEAPEQTIPALMDFLN